MNSEDDDKGNGDDCGAGISINSMTRSGVTALSSLMACSRLVSALCYSCLVTMALYLKPRAPFGLLDTAKGCSVARYFVLKGHRCCTVTATADTISTLRTGCTQRPCHNSERRSDNGPLMLHLAGTPTNSTRLVLYPSSIPSTAASSATR